MGYEMESVLLPPTEPKDKDIIEHNLNSEFLLNALKKIPKERKKDVVAYIVLKLTEIKNVLDYEKRDI